MKELNDEIPTTRFVNNVINVSINAGSYFMIAFGFLRKEQRYPFFQDLTLATDGNRYFTGPFFRQVAAFKILSYLTDKQLRSVEGSEDLNQLQEKHSTHSNSLYQTFRATVHAITNLSDSENDDRLMNNDLILEKIKGIRIDDINSSVSESVLEETLDSINNDLNYTKIQHRNHKELLGNLENEMKLLKRKYIKFKEEIDELTSTHKYLNKLKKLTISRLNYLNEITTSTKSTTPTSQSSLPASLSPSVDTVNVKVSDDNNENLLNYMNENESNEVDVDGRKLYHDSNKQVSDIYSDEIRNEESINENFVTDGETVDTLLYSINGIFPNGIKSVDFDNSHGTLFISGKLEKIIKIWDLSSKKEFGVLNGHYTTVNCLHLNSANQRLISGGKDGLVKVWDLNNINKKSYNESLNTFDETCCVHTFDSHSGEIRTLSLDNANLITSSMDKTIKHWDLQTGKCVQTFNLSLLNSRSRTSSSSNLVTALQSLDAAMATGDTNGLINLWDLRSGKVVRTIEGHTDLITALKFDSNDIITSSMDRSVREIDIRTWSLKNAYAYDSAVTAMDFDQDNIVSADEKSTDIKIYERHYNKHRNISMSNDDERSLDSYASINCIKYKDRCLVDGRENGDIHIWKL